MGISGFLSERRRLLLLFLRQIGREDWALRLENLGKPKNDQPGSLIDIGGHRLHILDLGEIRSPAVVFEADFGGWSVDWTAIQQETASFTRAVSYDRAGHGFSEPAQRPRTLPNLIEELHALLHNSSIRPPFVLVGRGLGGLIIESYARYYPEQIAGLVFVGERDQEEIVRLAKGQKLPWLTDPVRGKMVRRGAYRSAVKDLNKRIVRAGVEGLQKQLERAGPLPDVPVVRLRAEASDQEVAEAVRKILPET